MMRVGIVGMGRNGFMNHVMQSQETTDKLINDFEKAIAAGLDPTDALRADIFAKRRVKEHDLTDFDKERLNKKVEEIYQLYRSRRW